MDGNIKKGEISEPLLNQAQKNQKKRAYVAPASPKYGCLGNGVRQPRHPNLSLTREGHGQAAR
jgi:hypothetical protein